MAEYTVPLELLLDEYKSQNDYLNHELITMRTVMKAQAQELAQLRERQETPPEAPVRDRRSPAREKLPVRLEEAEDGAEKVS